MVRISMAAETRAMAEPMRPKPQMPRVRSVSWRGAVQVFRRRCHSSAGTALLR